jgi:AcrR family transcriptional regulator
MDAKSEAAAPRPRQRRSKSRATEPRRLSPAERREQIIEAAIAFFSEVGFEGRTRDLSSRIGVTQPLLYKYFPTKRALVEEVYARLYLGRLRPHWPELIRNRSLTVRERMTQFYLEYADAILTREWVRLFMFAGLEGKDLNRRYLKRLSDTVLQPLHGEIVDAIRATHGVRAAAPSMDDLWIHHGGFFYIGVRQHIYGLSPPKDISQAIESAVDRFLAAYGL